MGTWIIKNDLIRYSGSVSFQYWSEYLESNLKKNKIATIARSLPIPVDVEMKPRRYFFAPIQASLMLKFMSLPPRSPAKRLLALLWLFHLCHWAERTPSWPAASTASYRQSPAPRSKVGWAGQANLSSVMKITMYFHLIFFLSFCLDFWRREKWKKQTRKKTTLKRFRGSGGKRSLREGKNMCPVFLGMKTIPVIVESLVYRILATLFLTCGSLSSWKH